MPEIKDLPKVPGGRSCEHCACFLPAPIGAQVHGFCRLNPPHAVEAMVPVPWLDKDGKQRIDRNGEPQMRTEKALAHGYPSVPRFFTCWQWREPDSLPGERGIDAALRGFAAAMANMPIPEGPPFDEMKAYLARMGEPVVFSAGEDGEFRELGEGHGPTKN